MLFPIGDDDRTLTRPTYVTLGLVAANLAVFFLLQQMGANDAFTYGYSVIPWELVNGQDLVATQGVRVGGDVVPVPQAPGPVPIYLTVLTAMFMHGGFMHLFGNVLYLWIFGDNVEHRFGALPFLGFYLVSGFVATAVQVVLDAGSVVPNLGASGAISGVLGAYLVLFPRNRVYALFIYVLVSVPAFVAIGLWIVLQFVNGFGAVMVSSQQVGGVAYGAHIGGFAAGVAMALLHRLRMRREPADNVYYRRYEREASRPLW